ARSGRPLPPTYAARMSGLRTGVAEESTPESAPNTEAGSGATERGRRLPTLLTRAVTLVGTLAMTVLWAWLVTVVLDASNFPAPLNALRNRTFDAPALLPSVMV